MILTSLSLKNFKKYAAFDIEFSEGLVGIIGQNGSGKSTLFEAILFALYGEFKNRGEKELVRNANATTKDVVAVVLAFEFESHQYKVVREFRGKTLTANAKFYKNELLTTTGAREVSLAISSLTKMSKDVFMHTLFASQKELTSLSTLKNEDRKKMIRRLLGLEKIDYIEKELIEKSRELKRSILAFSEVLLGEDEKRQKEEQLKELEVLQKSLNAEIKEKTVAFETLKASEVALKSVLDVFVQTKEKKDKALNEIELLKNTQNVELKSEEKLKLELSKLEEKAKELRGLADVKTKYMESHSLLKEHERIKELHLKKEGLTKEQAQLREQYKKVLDEIKILQSETAPFQELEQEQKSKTDRLNTLKEELLKVQKNQSELNAKLSQEQRVVSDANAKVEMIQSLGSSSECPTCTRPLLEEYDNVLETLNQSILEIQTEKIQKYTQELQALQTELNSLQLTIENEQKTSLELSNKIALIQSKQGDLKRNLDYFEDVKKRGLANKEALEKLQNSHYEEEKHKEVEDALSAMKQKYEQVLGLETELKREALLKEELSVLTQKLENSKELLAVKKAEAKLIFYDENEHALKKNELDSLEKAKDKEQTKLHEKNLRLAKLQGEEKMLTTALKSNDTQLKKLQERQSSLQDYEKIKVSLVAFKTKLNGQIAPRISDTASKMYSQITKGKYQLIEVNNDFDFFIYDNGVKYPIERFSGGEVDLANLVLRIAISKTLTELSGANSIGFLAFDEVFGSQDETRRMQILDAFHTIKEQYRQIFLISHEMEIKEMFERVIEL